MITEPPTTIATAATDAFVPGALVALQSFRQTHPAFDGPYRVYYENLSTESTTALRNHIPDVELVPIGNDLAQRLDTLIQARPELKRQRSQFYSLEAFRPKTGTKTLFCDADLLFRADVSELWEIKAPLLAARDRPAYLGLARNRASFAIEPVVDSSLTETFNSGLMLIAHPMLPDSVFDDLLAGLAPSQWTQNQSGHTDQRLLNLAFEGQVHLVSARFNYLMKHEDVMKKDSQLALGDARVIHFNGTAKPWDLATWTKQSPASPSAIQTLTWWNEAFLDSLKATSLRACLAQT